MVYAIKKLIIVLIIVKMDYVIDVIQVLLLKKMIEIIVQKNLYLKKIIIQKMEELVTLNVILSMKMKMKMKEFINVKNVNMIMIN